MAFERPPSFYSIYFHLLVSHFDHTPSNTDLTRHHYKDASNFLPFESSALDPTLTLAKCTLNYLLESLPVNHLQLTCRK